MKPSSGLERLLATCGALAFALAPHVVHLPVWASAAFATTVVWRLLAEQRGWALPPQSVRLALALGATVGVFVTFRTLNGLDAGTALLTLMAALKLSETRAPRDHAVLVYVGYLLCLSTLLYEQSLVRLAYTLVAAWLLTAALARVHRPVEANSAVRPFRLAARILALGLPLTVVLFLFVPRIEGRFWSVPAAATSRTTGIDDQMSPGDVAQLGLSDEPAFRVRFEGGLPPPELRYWRMVVLEAFDGRRWRRVTTSLDFASPAIVPGGARYDYHVTLEPTQREWLPGLDTVTGWPRELASRGRAAQLVYFEPHLLERRTVTARLDYALESSTGARVMPEVLPADLRRRDLLLPEDRAPRSRALAQELRAAARSERDYIEAVLARFRRDGFSYTLEPAPLGEEPVDEFLFQTREGFCEHYASAFAVLMRAAGIPARVVIGYQGGDWNSYGGYLLVRQSSAHAWNEVWLAGEGWRRVDPTAAVAPDRIRRSQIARVTSGLAPERLFSEIAWLGRAREFWDAARTRWYEGVVRFGPDRQQRLLAALGLGEQGVRGLALALTTGFVVAALALAALLAWELRPRRRDPLVAAWEAVCDALGAAGLPRAACEGPLAYARRVAEAAPAFAGELDEVAAAYVAARYLPGATAADQARVVALARAFRARRRPRAP